MSFPKELKYKYKEGSLLPFIGAGVSMAIKWSDGDAEKRGPSWSELVDYAAKLMGYSDTDLLRSRGTDLQILEYFKQRYKNTAQLTNWLVRELHPPDQALLNSSIHNELVNLTKCKEIYTTNFDDFIERRFNLSDRKAKVISKESDMHRNMNGEIDIVKFHGDLNNPEMMVLTEADYEKRLTLSTELDYRFISDQLNRTILFLGYSFRDPNVSYIFSMINELFKNNHGPKAYIVVKHPSKFERTLFARRNIEVIPAETENLTDFTADLLSYIQKG